MSYHYYYYYHECHYQLFIHVTKQLKNGFFEKKKEIIFTEFLETTCDFDNQIMKLREFV